MLRALVRSLDSDNETLILPALGLLSYLLSCHQMYDIQVSYSIVWLSHKQSPQKNAGWLNSFCLQTGNIQKICFGQSEIAEQRCVLQVEKVMSITGETLLRLMSSRNGVNVLASLHFFKLLRVTEDITPIIVMSSNTADHLIQSLYLQLQNLTLTVRFHILNTVLFTWTG